MQFEAFKRIVTCFADHGDDVDTSGGELMVQIRDETLSAKLLQRPEGLIVEEDGQRLTAESWIVNRVARVPLLANRICSYVSPPPHFVTPSGRLLERPDQASSDESVYQENVVRTVTETLDRRVAGTTSVVYLTSDAGEGKTSLIDYLAVKQAEEYRAKRSDWLLVPIPLGGRPFLRFDDVVFSALVNRLRFQLLYYDAFLELVRLGVLVPAFAGFEEMIVESSSGEAISALGKLVARLRSAGTLLVAARKAYFDYPSFRSQARLFDSIGSDQEVAFSRVSLNRWDRKAFRQYALKRNVSAPDDLFDEVATRLGETHPVLTRAVLVTRLIDVARDEADLRGLLDRLEQDPQDYFHEFVGGLVEREANFKWLDTSGDPPQAILTTEEHHELLAMLAHEMWLSATDALRMDVVDLLVDLFAGARNKTPTVTRQIRERIKEHALLVRSGFSRKALAFDHEDFRVFYLGRALGSLLVEGDFGAIRSTIEKAALPASAVTEAVSTLRRQGAGLHQPLDLLQRLADGEWSESFVRENCGALAVALIDGHTDGAYEVRNMSFPDGMLRQRRLSNFTVSGSYFHATTLADAALRNCSFLNCKFERLEINDSARVLNSSLDNECNVFSIVRVNGEEQHAQYDPELIRRELLRTGFELVGGPSTEVEPPVEQPDPDNDLRLVQRFLRGFLRATALNESTIRRRLGVNANYFSNSLLPKLIQVGVVTEIQYQGHGDQRRMRLSAPMTRIEKAMSSTGGDFDSFVRAFRE